MKSVARLAFVSMLLCLPAQARDDRAFDRPNVEVGDALICETQQQVERYIALYRGDREAAIRAVNREEGDRTACAVLSAAFVRGPAIEAARHGDMAFEVLRILVVGVNTASGIRAVPPAPYFAAFGVVEYDV
jgi:hypothetical protein